MPDDIRIKAYLFVIVVGVMIALALFVKHDRR